MDAYSAMSSLSVGSPQCRHRLLTIENWEDMLVARYAGTRKAVWPSTWPIG